MIDKNILGNYVGKIYFRTGLQKKGRKKGSACLFYYKDRWLVATAAHCVYDFDYKYYYGDFFLKIKGFPKLELKKFVISELWIDKGDLEHDIAFFELPSKYQKMIDLEKLRPVFEIDYGKKVLLAGFPNYMIFFERLSTTEGISLKDEMYGTSLIGVKTRYSEGMSGGPLLYECGDMLFIAGTISFAFKSLPNVLWCVSWREEVRQLLNKL